MKEILRRKNSRPSSPPPPQVFQPSLLCVCAGYVDESGMIITQMGTDNRSECGRIVWDALYGTTPQQ
jgi:hypothetical protein